MVTIKKRKPVYLQLTPEVYDQLSACAEKNDRSLNKQVAAILKDFFKAQQNEERNS